MFKKLSEQLKANPRTIVFTEGTDARILEAADKLTAEGVLGVILLGKADEVKAAAKETGFNIDKCQIIDPEQYADIDAMVDEMVTLRIRASVPSVKTIVRGFAFNCSDNFLNMFYLPPAIQSYT